MPVNLHLEFYEIKDFTPGLFTVGGYLMPANGAQIMTDCRPDPGGGLRAAAKPVAFSTTGLPSDGIVCGMYVRGGIALESVASDGSDRYIAVYDVSATTIKVFRWNETPTSPSTSWTQIFESNTGARPNPVLFETFITGTGVTDAHVIFTIYNLSASDGLHSIQFSYSTGGSTTHRLSGVSPTGLAVYNDRILIGYGSVLRYGDSGSVSSFPAGNIENIQPNRQGSTILNITPYAPNDVLIGTRFSAWTQVQGVISDPIVRTMSDARTLGWAQRGAVTRGGLAFIGFKAGVFLTGTGDQFTDISEQIDPATFREATANNGDVGGGGCAYVGNTLLAPHGLAWDERTQSWYKFSVLSTADDHFHSWGDVNNRELFVATGGELPGLYTIEADESVRASTFTWKSAPLRHATARRINIREVQVVAEVVATGAQVVVTVNGTSRTRGSLAAGRHHLSFLLDEEEEYLDVQVVSTAASTGEAPRIEAVRVGAQAGHQAY